MKLINFLCTLTIFILIISFGVPSFAFGYFHETVEELIPEEIKEVGKEVGEKIEDVYEEGSKTIDEKIKEGTKYAAILPCISKIDVGTLNNFPLEQSTSVFRCITDHISITSQVFYDLVLELDLQNNFEEHFSTKKQSLLEEISLVTIPEDIENYTSEFAIPLQQSGYNEMVVHYFSSEVIESLSQFEEMDEDTALSLIQDIPTYDVETGEPTTLDKQLQKTIQSHPALKDTDFANSPIRSGLMLYFDSEFIFVTPIIRISDDQIISVEEYCRLEIDELYCDRLKKLGIMGHMAIKKDPTIAVKSIELFLILAQDLNKATDAGFDEELEFVDSYRKFIVEMDPEELENSKLIETESGKFVSINDLSTVKYNEHQINIAKRALTYMGSDHKGKFEQLDGDFEIFIEIVEDINNEKHSSIEFGLESKPIVPKWMKSWAIIQETDSDFVEGVKAMVIDERVIKSPNNLSGDEYEKVPLWFKNNVKWWGGDKIDDETFVISMEYLLEKGIIRVQNE